LASGAPAMVTDVFAGSLAGAWKAWQDNVTIPGLAWYPAFASFPGPQAPPTPGITTPLITLVSSKQSELTSSQRLAGRIFEQLNGAQIPPDVRVEIERFSKRASGSFLTWLTGNQVVGVQGQGPVPTFAPPSVPTGPVVGGSVIPVPGIIRGSHLN
jgi:hypothetical protein